MKGQNSQSSAYNGKSDTISLSKDNEAARRRLRRRITNTLRKPTTPQTCAGLRRQQS
jgi:hypothetical protein